MNLKKWLKKPFIQAVLYAAAIMLLFKLCSIIPTGTTLFDKIASFGSVAIRLVLGLAAILSAAVLSKSTVGRMLKFKRSAVMLIPLGILLVCGMVFYLRASMDFLRYLRLLIGMLSVGFFEESVFRGGVMGIMMKNGGNSVPQIKRACLTSGLLFGLVHLTNIFSGVDACYALMQAFGAMSMGIFLSLIYIQTGSLWYPILFHGLADCMTVSLYSSVSVGNVSLSLENVKAIYNVPDTAAANLLFIVVQAAIILLSMVYAVMYMNWLLKSRMKMRIQQNASLISGSKAA